MIFILMNQLVNKIQIFKVNNHNYISVNIVIKHIKQKKVMINIRMRNMNKKIIFNNKQNKCQKNKRIKY